jgi:hypothetical protein
MRPEEQKIFWPRRGGHLQGCKRAKALFTEGWLGLQAYRQAYKRATKRTGRQRGASERRTVGRGETKYFARGGVSEVSRCHGVTVGASERRTAAAGTC